MKYTKQELLKLSSLSTTLKEANILGRLLPLKDLNVYSNHDIRPYHFFDVYESLGLDRNSQYNLLEIGNRWCGSLWGWRVWLPESNIFGLDIDPETKYFSNQNEKIGIKIYEGDQTDKTLLNQIHTETGGLDIVIDDGGHTMGQINTTFETLWPLLNDGGVYIVEDLHTCYWPSYEGGYKAKNSSMEMFKSLFDNIHSCYYKAESPDSDQAKHLTINEPSNYLDKSVSSIHMYDSLVVIYKNIKPKLKPFSPEGNFTIECLTDPQNFKNLKIPSMLTPDEVLHYKSLYTQGLKIIS